jgi:hypothetical protein
MSRPLDELQAVLAQLIEQQRKLLAETDRHQAAIRTMNVAGMESSRARQEAIRLTIAALEPRRRLVTEPLAAAMKIPAPTLTQLADLHPQHRAKLLAQRDELRQIISQITQRTTVAGKITGAVLTHLNRVVRLMAGTMQQAGVYTKHGVPKLAPRIGAIETVG